MSHPLKRLGLVELSKVIPAYVESQLDDGGSATEVKANAIGALQDNLHDMSKDDALESLEGIIDSLIDLLRGQHGK